MGFLSSGSFLKNNNEKFTKVFNGSGSTMFIFTFPISDVENYFDCTSISKWCNNEHTYQ